MKICPTCGKAYEDESLKFCLEDGASLREVRDNDPNATWNLARPDIPPTVAARPTAKVQATLTARPEQFQPPRSGPATDDRESRRSSSWPWIFAMVVVIAIAGVLTAWLLSRGGSDQIGMTNSATPEPSISRTPTATPEKPKGPFEVFDNTSLNGSRITYYPRPTFELCQSDCAANSSCKGFTWIRPGAYNPGDSAMCYLMSAVTDKISNTNCCISAEKN